VKSDNNSIRGFLFRAKPDGRPADVLVAWSTNEMAFELPAPPKACFDHLGRPHDISGKVLKLGRAPLYAVLDTGTQLQLVPAPQAPKRLPGEPSPVVLQALLPEESILLEKSAYKIPPGQTTTIPIFVYNFSAKPVRGRLTTSLSFESVGTTVPGQWGLEFPSQVEVAPGERKELSLRVNGVSTNSVSTATIRITGEFGRAGKPVLSVRLSPTVK
jgi:hypothetical protein